MKDKELLALVKRAVAGDTKAFEALCERKLKDVVYLCIMELGNTEDAQDASQEVFLRLQKNITALRSPEAFNVWLNRVVVTTCDRVRRKKMRQTPVFYDDFFEDENLPDTLNELPLEAVEREDTRRLIEDLVKELPEKYRLCVMLHYYQKLSYAEVAQVLGISAGSVDNNLRMARRLLKEGLEKKKGFDYSGREAVPMLAVGPALLAVFENRAAAALTPQLAKSCLAGIKGSAAVATAVKLAVFQKMAIGFFALTVATVSFTFVTHFSSPQQPNVTGLPAGSPQSHAGQGGVQNGLEDRSSSARQDMTPHTIEGDVYLRDAEGHPIPLPSGAQVILLDPQQQIVACAPLEENGDYRFENLEVTQTGVYVVRAVDAKGNPIEGVGDMEIYLEANI